MNGKINYFNLIKIFEDSNLSFLNIDKSLLLTNTSERSWYNRFAIYMTEQIKKYGLEDYYVDTEYNRNGNNLKTIFNNDDLKIINVTCDIILHSRGKIIDNDNLICIEIKKSTAPQNEKKADKNRLMLLTKKSYNDIWSADGKTLPEHVCGYKLGVYYEVNVQKKSIYLEYYIDGELLDTKTLKNIF